MDYRLTTNMGLSAILWKHPAGRVIRTSTTIQVPKLNAPRWGSYSFPWSTSITDIIYMWSYLLFEETFTASIFLKRRKKGTLRTGRRREHNVNAIQTQAGCPAQISVYKILKFQTPSEGRVLCMFEGIKMLKPSEAVDPIIPGIWACQWSSFKSFCPCS